MPRRKKADTSVENPTIKVTTTESEPMNEGVRVTRVVDAPEAPEPTEGPTEMGPDMDTEPTERR